MAGHAEGKPLPSQSKCCCICGEESVDLALIRACRVCDIEYCQACVAEMFKGAITDFSRMPPKCCVFLQLHTAVRWLTDQEANNYRAKLEEFICPDKLYCPAPTCSTFISPRLIPPLPSQQHCAADDDTSLAKVLSDIVAKIFADPAARFFRGEVLDITQAPGYATVVSRHVDLAGIQAHLQKYQSARELTADMQLLVSNAKSYNGTDHPISKTAEELYNVYLSELCHSLDKLSKAGSENATYASMFACPKCHVGLCTKCKQIEHGKAPCDTSARDHELAMLAQFRIKQCPNCKHAIRKMYGCSHMQCRCGAHFCYYCARSIDQCDGSCEERAYESEGYDDDDEGDEDEDEDEAETGEDDESNGDEDSGLLTTASNTAQAGYPAPEPIDAETQHVAASDIINLDAGGGRRWAETGMNFGDEPDESEAYDQIWSCSHTFSIYYSKDDGADHGDESRMECNRCFSHVSPAAPEAEESKKRPAVKHKRRETRRPPESAPQSPVQRCSLAVDLAWECSSCRLVACGSCKTKYEAETTG